MKKEELRIGNLFIDTVGAYCNPNTIQKVVNIGYDGVNAWSDMGASGNCEYEKMQPIPLTEEWLIKFGVIDKKEIENSFGKYKESCIYGGISIEYENNSLSTNGTTKIEYVHQLQNLYFALTGEELNVKKC